jgi:hypothetical protein
MIAKKYLSAVYDLRAFNIFKITNAIVFSDADDGILFNVSFDNGNTFQSVEPNVKFPVITSNGRIQVKITFEDVSVDDIYTVKATGFFQNLAVGTTVNFTKISTNTTYTTKIGRDGYYNISLPRGKYDVWYVSSGKKETLMMNYNPEITQVATERLDKESMIEGIFRDVDWAKYSVFDTFADRSKMTHGGAIIDPEGNLSDGTTNRKCRFWALGFD